MSWGTIIYVPFYFYCMYQNIFATFSSSSPGRQAASIFTLSFFTQLKYFASVLFIINPEYKHAPELENEINKSRRKVQHWLKVVVNIFRRLVSKNTDESASHAAILPCNPIFLSLHIRVILRKFLLSNSFICNTMMAVFRKKLW